jgi:hypothetical protein
MLRNGISKIVTCHVDSYFDKTKLLLFTFQNLDRY